MQTPQTDNKQEAASLNVATKLITISIKRDKEQVESFQAQVVKETTTFFKAIPLPINKWDDLTFKGEWFSKNSKRVSCHLC